MAEAGELLTAYARRGDIEALSSLVASQSVPLAAFLRGLLASDEDAEDALQETWLRVVRFAGAYRGGSARAYLFRVARSVAIDRMRRAGAPMVSLDAEDEEGARPIDELADDAPPPDEAFATKATAEDVRRATRELPLGPREVLLLRIEGDLTFREIAEQLEIPLGTALTWMRTATQTLRKKLGEKR